MNFLEAQSSLIKVLRSIKYFTYKVDFNHVTLDSKSLKKCIYFLIFCIIVFLVTNFYCVLTLGSFLPDDNPVTLLMTRLEALAMILSIIIIIYGSIFRRHSQVILLNRLLCVEREIVKMKFSRLQYNEKLKYRVNLEMIFNVMFMIYWSAFYVVVLKRENFALFFILTLNYIIFDCFLLCAIQFIRNLILTFRNLLYELVFNLKSHILLRTLNFKNEEVKNIFIIRNDLIESINLFNKSFGVQVLGTFIYLFGISSLEIYFAFTRIALMPTSDLSLTQIIMLIGNAAIFLPIFTFLLQIGFACTSVKEAVKKSMYATIKMYILKHSFYLGQQVQFPLEKSNSTRNTVVMRRS